MKKIINQRRIQFQKQNLKYLKYVLNDHFVLVLLFLLGFILVQYQQLLKHFPENPIFVILGLVLLFGIILPWGNIASYLEPADRQFILSKELEVSDCIIKASWRTFIVWGSIQTLIFLGLFPLFSVLGIPIWAFIVMVIGALGVKYRFITLKLKRMLKNRQYLSWDVAITAERRRRQAILKFFALFTTIKGLSTSVKRRVYLDRWTSLVEKKRSYLWLNLYFRAFLRAGDYLGLTFRLLLLALSSLVFISTDFVAISMTTLFHFLLGFQLLSLYHHFDYHQLSRLFPADIVDKKGNLLAFLRGLLYGVVGLELVVSLVVFKLMIMVQIILLTILLVEVYLRYKIYKMID